MIDLPNASFIATKRRIQLGIESPPVESEKLANLCILFWRMPGERQYEFFQLKADRATKQAFLLRCGHFEQGRKPT